MRKKVAEILIGKLVLTGFMHGGARYIGVLQEVLPSKPFRANICVCAIQHYPYLYCHNTVGKFDERMILMGNSIVCQKGSIINVGNGIEVFFGDLPSYKNSLIKSLENYIDSVKYTLDEFKKTKGNYFTCYIDNLKDCQRLYDILIKRLEDARAMEED